MRVSLAMVTVFLILSLACTTEALSSAQVEPTPPPVTTSPNLQATIDAAVEATISALPPSTATPIPDPTTPWYVRTPTPTPTVLAMGESFPLQILRGNPPVSQNLQMTVSNPQWKNQELSVDVTVNNTSTTKVSLFGDGRVDRYHIEARDAAGNSGIRRLHYANSVHWSPRTDGVLWPETQVHGVFSWKFGPASQNIQIIVCQEWCPMAIWEVNGTTQ